MRRDQQVSTGRSGEPQERIASLKRQSVYQWLSRLGYAARGTVYLVIGWLALSLALGWGGKFADSKEAIRYLATMTAGDVILSIEDTPIGSVAKLLSVLDDYRIGDRVRLRVLRGGREQELEVLLAGPD